MNGGSDNDFLFGFTGKDTMTGGAGADQFFYGTNAASETGKGTSADIIKDFLSGVDKINVAAVDANTVQTGNKAFTFIGVGSFNDEGQIQIQSNSTGDARFSSIPRATPDPNLKSSSRARSWWRRQTCSFERNSDR